MRITGIAAALLSVVLISGGKSAADAIDSFRSLARDVSGIRLSESSARMLSGLAAPGDVVIHPPTNQVLILNRNGGVEDFGEMMVDASGGILSVAFASGRSAVASPRALARLLEAAPPDGDPVEATACLDRLAVAGGTILADVGPLRSGWRLEPDRQIYSETAWVGNWEPTGSNIVLTLGSVAEQLACGEIVGVLSEPPSTAQTSEKLAELIQVLEDGNFALDRLLGYQRKLSELARSSARDALSARRPVQDCRKLPTLAILCDRLNATYRQR